MSYPRPNTGDPELDRQIVERDFRMILPKLQAAETEQGFDIWLDKLALIDRQAIVAYLRERWDTLSRSQRLSARIRLRELRSDPMY